jgi:segregation and condensation protein B
MSRGAFSFVMSLKAKLEAVIYAAEEPVTLAQLAVIFADEVPQETAEAPAVEPAPDAEQPAVEGDTAPVAEAATEASPETAPDADAEPGESDQKKAARQRDKRVRQALQVVLDELIADYANGDRGMEVREIAGGYRMATKPEYHDAVRGFIKSLKPPMKLSLQALETLAVIAYKQPVTAPEVSEIRGVDSGGVLGSLVSRKLITTAGRKQVIGRPILYKTTKEFLLRFGLKDVNDLPSMEEFEKMAGELVEPETPGEHGEPEASSEQVEHEVSSEHVESEAASEPGEPEISAEAGEPSAPHHEAAAEPEPPAESEAEASPEHEAEEPHPSEA